MTDIDECSWPATTDSTPMNRGLFRYVRRYSRSGYWYSCRDCQRHMFWLGAAPDASPLGCIGGTVFCQVVIGYDRVSGGGFGLLGGGNVGSGYAGVARVASSTRVQLRLPLPPWPACTNQSKPQGVSTLSVAFFTSFCIEIEPSEQVVWLWKSPVTYLPRVLAFAAEGATAN